MDLADWLRTHPTARLACVSAAERRGLAVLHPPERPHIALPQRYGGRSPDARVHRSRPLVPTSRDAALESVPDMLAHVAHCLAREEAFVIWESAINRGLTTAAALRRVRWHGPVPRAIAAGVSGKSESPLETLAFHRLRAAGLPVRQQVPILGHRVDLLVGETIVVQLDGFAYHSAAADRRRDLEHDARLLLEGYLVLRFDYVAVVHRPERMVETVGMAFAQRAA